MPSSTEKQAKFMTACAKGWDAESCPPMEVSRKFHEADKKEGKFICKDGCEHSKKPDAAMDDAGVAVPAPIGPMARLKLVRELSQIKTDIAAAGAGPMAAMKRLKLTAKANEIRMQLGASAPAVKSDPAPVEDANLTTLRDVAAGKFDGDGLLALYERIRDAVVALEGTTGAPLSGDAEAAAQAAITHWAELEVKVNGD